MVGAIDSLTAYLTIWCVHFLCTVRNHCFQMLDKCLVVQKFCLINALGLPFNIASYALLTMMVAQQCDLALGDFVWTGGDTHLYSNHMEQTALQLSREPRPLPTMTILRKPASIFDYQFEDFELTHYDPHPHIKAPVAV